MGGRGGAGRAVIVGGGITGILTARELLLGGWQVVVLEGAHVGAGSSSRTAAGIRQQFSTPGTVRGMRYAVRAYQALADELQGSPIVQNGYLFLHADEEAWRVALQRADMQRAAGLTELEVLQGDELARRFPWLEGGEAIGGTFCPTDGFLLPELIYGEGARRVRELGGEVVQGAPVTAAEHAGERLVAVRTPKGRFEGDLFLDCTNAWTGRVGPLLGGEPLPVDPLKRYLWFLARGEALPREVFAAMPLVVGPTGVYCRPENPESLLMGRAHQADPEPGFSYEDQDVVAPDFTHRSGLDAAPFDAWMQLAATIPPFAELGGVTATTSGYYGSTPDHNPFLGYDRQVPNLLRLVGFSGHGAMFGPFTARVARALAEAGHDLAEVILDGEPVPLEAFRIGRSFGDCEAMVI